MRANLTQFAVSAGLAVLAVGCAGGSGTYPSLAMRPVESGAAPSSSTPPAAQPIRPAPVPLAEALPAPGWLADQRAAAQALHTTFIAQETAAARLAAAAAGQPFDSAPHAAAMVALADLDAQRARTASVLAAVDGRAVAAATTLSPDPALAAAQAEIAALLARQDAGIARVWSALGG
jgi:hypothetical protein